MISAAVAPTDIAKPTDSARNGSSTTRPAHAPASTSIGRIRRSSSSVTRTTPAIAAARSTEGCGRAITTYAATASATTSRRVAPRRRPTRRPRTTTTATTTATLPPLTAVRWARPESRIACSSFGRLRGGVADDEPGQQAAHVGRSVGDRGAQRGPDRAGRDLQRRRAAHRVDAVGDERGGETALRVGGQHAAGDRERGAGQQGRDVGRGDDLHRQVEVVRRARELGRAQVCLEIHASSVRREPDVRPSRTRGSLLVTISARMKDRSPAACSSGPPSSGTTRQRPPPLRRRRARVPRRRRGPRRTSTTTARGPRPRRERSAPWPRGARTREGHDRRRRRPHGGSRHDRAGEPRRHTVTSGERRSKVRSPMPDTSEAGRRSRTGRAACASRGCGRP